MTSTSRIGWVLVGAVAMLPTATARAETLTLDEAIHIAATKNERIGIARTTVEGAEIGAASTWNRIKPSVSISGIATLQPEIRAVPSGDLIQQRTQYDVTAMVSQPLFRRGLFAARDASTHAVAAADAQLEFECTTLARDVAVAYINVVRARALLTNSESASKRAVAQYNFAVNRVKAGSALKTVELLAQIDVKRSERQRVSAQREVGRAEATFVRLVGVTPPELVLPEDPNVPSLDVAFQAANNRSDLIAIKERIEQSLLETEAASGRRLWPLFDVTASVNAYAPQLNDRNYDWRVLGVVTIPIFQSGTEYTEIAFRKNQARLAELQIALQKRTVIEQIETGAVDFETSRQAALLAEQQRDTAREHYSLVDKQFRLGAVTFLDVTTAQAALVEAENAFEVARIEKVRALYDFLYASGRLDASTCGHGGGAAVRRPPPSLASPPPSESTKPPAEKPKTDSPPPEAVPDI